MSSPDFYPTRQDAKALSDIHAHSIKQCGRKTADQYLADIYTAMNKVAAKRGVGQTRKHRATPFIMIAPVREHFIVYDRLASGVVILTLLHQRRDIESVIADMSSGFLAEIEAVRKNNT